MRGFTALVALFAVLLVGAFAVAGCGGDDDEAGGDEVTVDLAESMGSGQTATATLTAEGEQTTVSIEVDGDPVSDSQPAHIHEGTCEQLNAAPAFGLPNVTDGTSEATVDVSLETLTAGEYAINLHMSDEDLATYTSCGNITA
jgi:ABC-type glycerol-3-phosphate transport system substrate-binding protein